MKTLTSLFILTTILHAAQSHWIWARVAHNGAWLEPMRYIRNHTSPFYDEPILPPNNGGYLDRRASEPTYARDLPNSVRCGRGTFDHAATTETLKVKAGDKLELQQVRSSPEDFNNPNFKTLWNCSTGYGACAFWDGMEKPMDFNHWGPRSVHLSKVPDGQDVTTYDGSGEWTKIDTVGVEIKNNMMKWKLFVGDNQLPPRVPFKIPTQTPSGQYLLRIDLMWPGVREYQDPLAQLYPGCMQIEVESAVRGSLPKGVKIPEILTHGKPGTVYSGDMNQCRKVDADYVYPGGPLWDGEKLYQDRPPLATGSGCRP